MVETAVAGRLTWLAASVAGAVVETARVRALELAIPGWPGQRADAKARGRFEAAVAGRLAWLAAPVPGAVVETPRVRTLELAIPGWPGHRAGQHLDVRLTAEDGYQAQRSYSIASAP